MLLEIASTVPPGINVCTLLRGRSRWPEPFGSSSSVIRLSVPRRRLPPLIPRLAELVAKVEESNHVVLLERLSQRHIEGRRDVGQVEVHSVALGRRIDPVEIAHALILN